ncbi:MAG: energy-coupled thiamine transporter ThiT [Firmicutes bacterium]|nr:energy-coupled thiamine transporter ThiT [Bacillota bacterium]
MSSKNDRTTRRLVISAMLIAIATVLSLVKIVDLPYGGSVSLGSMLPIVIIAYRYGTPWGLLCGLIHGLIQLALGANTLSYVTGAASVIAVIMLDYLVAFGVIGFAGLTRKGSANQSAAFLSGSLIACFLRYVCHVISGCTVWAGLSIPTGAAFQYSLIYNATYMLPETLVLLIIAYYLSTTLDFGSEQLKMIQKQDTAPVAKTLNMAAGLVLAGGLVFDIAAVFRHLQNAETGEFDITGISQVSWTLVLIVTLICALVAVALFLVNKKVVRK